MTVINPALSNGYRVGRKVLVLTYGAGGPHCVIEYLDKCRLTYSVGLTLPG